MPSKGKPVSQGGNSNKSVAGSRSKVKSTSTGKQEQKKSAARRTANTSVAKGKATRARRIPDAVAFVPRSTQTPVSGKSSKGKRSEKSGQTYGA